MTRTVQALLFAGQRVWNGPSLWPPPCSRCAGGSGAGNWSRFQARLSHSVCVSLTETFGVSWSWSVLAESERKFLSKYRPLRIWALPLRFAVISFLLSEPRRASTGLPGKHGFPHLGAARDDSPRGLAVTCLPVPPQPPHLDRAPGGAVLSAFLCTLRAWLVASSQGDAG